jgi:hypothetical protein
MRPDDAVRRNRSIWVTLAAALSTAVLLTATPMAYAGESRIGINGARPSDLPILSELLGDSGFTQEGWLHHASRVGANWLPGRTVVPLDYPAQLGPLWGTGALTGDQSLVAGQQALHTAILAELEKGQTVAVAGLSLGTMVIDREIAYLHSLPVAQAPDPAKITFYVFGGESRGFGQMYARGVTIPLIGITFRPVPETRYNTVVVYGQWDGWANPPDRPWNGLAVLNAVMGALYTINGTNDHSKAAKASLSEADLVSKTTNIIGGTTWTYMIPEKNLPVTRPLRQLGVPGSIVDKLNVLLTPLIATGYSSMTPELGLHIANGRLVWKAPPPAATSSPPTILPTATAEQSRARSADSVIGDATPTGQSPDTGLREISNSPSEGEAETGLAGEPETELKAADKAELVAATDDDALSAPETLSSHSEPERLADTGLNVGELSDGRPADQDEVEIERRAATAGNTADEPTDAAA